MKCGFNSYFSFTAFHPIASDGSFAYLFNMGATKENIRFHTSVLCEGDVQFFFATKETINGNFYVVTFRRSSLNLTNSIRVDFCGSLKQLHENSCFALYKWEVKTSLAQMIVMLTYF
jgi:hypothetical protein